MSGIEVGGAAVRAGLTVAAKSGGWFVRKVRPDTSRLSIEVSGDTLADAVQRSETRLLNQLAAGVSTRIDVGLSVTSRQRLIDTDTDVVDLTDLGGRFNTIKAPARMVIVGAPGAGKTVAAIYLVLDLLRQRAQLPATARVAAPVPVRVTMSGWDGVDLAAWLSYRLTIDYQIHSRVTRTLVEDGRILPVLDGLDEMDHPTDPPTPPLNHEPPHSHAAIATLNSASWRNHPLVVTCRSDDYQHLRESRADGGLRGATVLTLQPLTPDTIIDYLAHYHSQRDTPDDSWDLIIDQIISEPEGPLAHALSTPWLLGLTVGALEHTPEIAQHLADGQTTPEIQNLLFASLIPAAVANTDTIRTKTTVYTTDAVQRWITTLAHYLDTTTDRTIRLNQLWRIAGNTPRIVHGLAAGLAAGLTVGLAFGLAAGLVAGLAVGLAGGLAFGLAFGLAAGHAAWMTNDDGAKRWAWRVPGRSRWPHGIVVGLAVGLMIGLMIGLTVWLTVGLAAGLTVGLTVWLTAGLTVGLTAGLSTTSADRLRLGQDETRVIRDDLAAGLAAGLTFGLTVGLAAGLTFGLVVGRAFGLTFGLAFGLAFGLGAGLTGGLAAGRYACLCLVLTITGVFPSRPAVFLDWARRAGLLRVTGTGYQFRHDTYQQWLVDAAAGSMPPGDNQVGGSRR